RSEILCLPDCETQSQSRDSDAVPLVGGSRPRAERMTLRTLIFWPHLIAGVVAGVVVLTMSVTGVLLTYERQLNAWSDSEFKSTPPATGAAPLSVEDLVTTVRLEHPDVEVGAVTFNSRPDAPVSITAGRQTIYADAYTGRVLGE